MYPTFEIFDLKIYTFWVLMSITWLLFFVLLHHFSWKEGFTKSIFSDRAIIYFTISIVFFARFFYIFSEWRDEQFILRELSEGNILWFLRLFFTPESYHFSLFGWVVGFVLVFFSLTQRQKMERLRYFDAIMWAFLYAALLGYIATLLGGQIYGFPVDSFLSIVYNHKESIVPIRTGTFPLPVIYLIGTLGIIGWVRWFEKKIGEIPYGFIGFLSLWIFSGMIFLWEFFNGSEDMFESYFFLNLNQIGALIGIIISLIWIFRNIEKKI